MSHTYHMLCIECREVADLGKLVNMDQQGTPIPLGFAGWRDQSDGEWVGGERLWQFIERWLLLHRGHEFIIVPDSWLDEIDPEGNLNYVDSVGDLMKATSEYPADVDDAAWKNSDALIALRRKLNET